MGVSGSFARAATVVAVGLGCAPTPREPQFRVRMIDTAPRLTQRAVDPAPGGTQVVVATGQFVDRYGDYAVLGRAPRASDVELVMPVIEAALEQYSRAAYLVVSRAVLCQELSMSGQLASGVADGNTRTIYLDAAYGPGEMRRTIHHEVFHVLDRAMHGVPRADPAWEALNPPGHEHWPEGLPLRKGPPDPGFVSPYAMRSPTEDKAELFADLMIDRDRVLALAKRDAIIASKLRMLCQRVRHQLGERGLPAAVRSAISALGDP